MPNLSLPTIGDIEAARRELPEDFVFRTPLEPHARLSNQHGADIYLKREDMQGGRSYKRRGAGNAMLLLPPETRKKGVVCASAGNHSQGFSASCNYFHVHGVVFMPKNTPQQKIDATRQLGNGFVEIRLVGDTFDEANVAARNYVAETGASYIHPFDDGDTIAGQGTVALEIFEQMSAIQRKVDLLLVPVGGGGLVAGSAICACGKSPQTKVIGVEPEHAAAMHASLEQGHLVTLQRDRMSRFVDGAAVLTPGELTFQAVRDLDVQIRTVPEDRVCGTMIDLFNREGMVTEPAGVLSIDALTDIAADIHGQTVVCVLSGSNFDLSRYPDVLERSDRFRRRKRYFTVEMPNRPEALSELLDLITTSSVNISDIDFHQVASGGMANCFIGLESIESGVLDQAVLRLRGYGTVEEETKNPLLAELLKRR